MHEALWKNGGVWFGWSGNVADQHVDSPAVFSSGPMTYLTVDLTSTEYRNYYLGFANATLWPILHYRLGLVEYDHEQYQEYLRVNERFARLLARVLEPDDTIWVHDYHLIPLGAALRRLNVANPIGFFLHTPCPGPDVFAALPRHEDLLRAFAAYDLVGFQTDDARDGFLECVAKLTAGRRHPDGQFSVHGRHSRAAVFPVGIDAETFHRAADNATNATEVRRLAASLAGRKLIIGVDRLDYSKGIAQRFDAIEKLLGRHPDYQRKFNYLQITPRSREEVPQYGALGRQLEATAGRVNGKYAECDWTPIRHVHKGFSRRTLAGFYRLAHVGLVTPLRDGMNLVAKEYVAAQLPSDPGVLILSRFAGAAHELTQALLVNPIDTFEIAMAIERALAMSLQERQKRWKQMMTVLRGNTIEGWRDAFLFALVQSREDVAIESFGYRAAQ
jgi:trehalose 6-phosphate synthase